MTVGTLTDGFAADINTEAAERPIYLDHNATTPVDARVASEVLTYMAAEFGNAGSRTHGYGQTAKERVNRARREVAAVVGANPDEVVFTSGATESDNLSILGLAAHGDATGKRHIVSTAIEHKAVLEPLDELVNRGFDVTLVPPTSGGWVEADAIRSAVRDDTLFVQWANGTAGTPYTPTEDPSTLSGPATFCPDGATLQQIRPRRISSGAQP